MSAGTKSLFRLTARQREHLRELADLRDASVWREAYWSPSGSGEYRSARALLAVGLLEYTSVGGSYRLTEVGYQEARRDA